MIVNPVFYLILNSLLRLCVIMPASACSWMWQWVSQIQGCSGTKPILTLSLGPTRTVFSIAYLITFLYPEEYFVDEHRVKPRAIVIENDFLGYTIWIITLSASVQIIWDPHNFKQSTVSYVKRSHADVSLQPKCRDTGLTGIEGSNFPLSDSIESLNFQIDDTISGQPELKKSVL